MCYGTSQANKVIELCDNIYVFIIHSCYKYKLYVIRVKFMYMYRRWLKVYEKHPKNFVLKEVGFSVIVIEQTESEELNRQQHLF